MSENKNVKTNGSKNSGNGKNYSNKQNNQPQTEEQKFWDHYRVYKENKFEDPMVAIESAEWLQKNIKVDKLDKNGQYYEFISKFLDGKRVLTKDGRMIWAFGEWKNKTSNNGKTDNDSGDDN